MLLFFYLRFFYTGSLKEKFVICSRDALFLTVSLLCIAIHRVFPFYIPQVFYKGVLSGGFYVSKRILT